MQYIAHRINWLNDLKRLPEGMGAEIDLRSWGEEIHMDHDAFKKGESFSDFLREWVVKKRGTLILNMKEDGLENGVMESLHRFGIEDYFFLDLPFPTVVRMALNEEISSLAVRVSEFEPLELALNLKGKIDWVWVDCFSGEPPSEELLRALSGFKICLVSPELQKYPLQQIDK
ncbi:MAG: hypothetical protein KDD45_11690, partial [Bdellovibrionales bacterium]|nr:hypothetical protein [Bdellovibrionales bacterium]